MMHRPTQEPFPAGENVVIRSSSFFPLTLCWSVLITQDVLRGDTSFSSSTAVPWTCNKDIAHLPGAYFATAAGEGKAAPQEFTLLLCYHAFTSNLHPNSPSYNPFPKFRK